ATPVPDGENGIPAQLTEVQKSESFVVLTPPPGPNTKLAGVYYVDLATQITVLGKPAKLADLTSGQQVLFKARAHRSRRVLEFIRVSEDATSSQPAAEPLRGVIISVLPDGRIQIRGTERGRRSGLYSIDDRTDIQVYGKKATAGSLNAGHDV